MTTGADTVVDVVDAKRCPECASRFGRDAAFCPFDGTALQGATWDPSAAPLTTSVVAGRYEVIEPLGEGGMGTVYKVRHMTLDRFFAMKVLRRELAKDPALAARFMQEARATAAIHHPSIVAITDFGVLDDGAPYFVMEMLVGETLATYLHARGLLPPRTAAAIARRIAEALEAAHRVGVVHRDLKPENVFLVGGVAGKAPTDDVRIVDFGAAKVMGKTQLTRPGVVFGTPYYMSPEQASGEALDGRADVYSLGVLLYEMVTGTLPFEADTYMGVLTKHMFESPTKPSDRATGVQLGALEDIVMRALEKDPKDRYASMREFASALNRGGASSVAPPANRGTHQMPNAPALPVGIPPSPSGRPVEFHAPRTADKIESSVARHLEADARRQRRLIAIGAVCVIGAIGVIGLARSLSQSEPDTLPKPPVVSPRSSALTTLAAPVAPLPSAPAPDRIPQPDPPAPAPAPAAETAPPEPTTSASLSPPPRSVTVPSRPPPPRPATLPAAAPPAATAAGTTNAAPPHVDDLPDPWAKPRK